jgi:hypothetical protein
VTLRQAQAQAQTFSRDLLGEIEESSNYVFGNCVRYRKAETSHWTALWEGLIWHVYGIHTYDDSTYFMEAPPPTSLIQSRWSSHALAGDFPGLLPGPQL